MPTKIKVLIGALIVIAAASLGTAGYYFNQLQEIKQDPQQKAKLEAKAILDKVSKLIYLPEGEEPKVSTITLSELEKVKDQPFFNTVAVGDKALIYPEARLMFIYDPVNNKIRTVGSTQGGQTAEIAAPRNKTNTSIPVTGKTIK